MEFIKFIFSNFWIFIGFLCILAVIFNGIAEIIRAIKGYKIIKESEVETKN